MDLEPRDVRVRVRGQGPEAVHDGTDFQSGEMRMSNGEWEEEEEISFNAQLEHSPGIYYSELGR